MRSVSGPGTVSQMLVERWLELPAAEIPPHARKRAILCIKDTIGISLAAAALDIGTACGKLAQAVPGPVSLWGTGTASTATEAAFANGMLAHAMDFDDLHPAAIMHSSAVIVPAVVALAERQQLCGTEMLAAAVVGYEVAAWLGCLAPGDFQRQGFQSTAVLGPFAAAIVAARILKLTPKQAVHALGIAGSMASGLMEFLADGSDTKQMHAGWAAQSGVRAAELAAVGFTGPATVFEGRFGVYGSFVGKQIDPHSNEPTSAETWAVEEMCPKPYPACLCLHAVVQAVLEIRARLQPGDLDPVDIVSIMCEVPSFYTGLVFDPPERKMSPQTSYEARFSAHYCMARAWIDGSLEVESFSPDRLSEPEVASLAAKISYAVKELPEFPETFPAKVTIKRSSGETSSAYVAANLGSARNPMTDAQLDDKFMRCAGVGLGHERATALAASIDGLMERDGSHRFFSALRSAKVCRDTVGVGQAEDAFLAASA